MAFTDINGEDRLVQQTFAEHLREHLGREPDRAMMGTAIVGGPNRAAANMAVASPPLEGIDLICARGVLVLIAASKGTSKLAESRNAMNTRSRYRRF